MTERPEERLVGLITWVRERFDSDDELDEALPIARAMAEVVKLSREFVEAWDDPDANPTGWVAGLRTALQALDSLPERNE